MQRSALAEGPEGSRSEVLDLIHEHCEGGNLATALQSGFFLTPDKRLHNNNVMQVVWEMSVGLNYLHSKGAVHGALSNMFLLKSRSGVEQGPVVKLHGGAGLIPRFGVGWYEALGVVQGT